MGEYANPRNSTVRLPVAPLYGSSLNTEVTVFVLLTGILVGLLLVVIVLCVCKCCVKTSKPLKRQHVVFTKYSSERESTWNGKEAGCTKYHSMEPRASPCSSVVMDIEVGYAENSTGHSKERRDRDDRLLDVVSLTPSPSSLNVRTPGDRVFQECSRESSPRQSVIEQPTIQYPSTSSSRTPEEIRIYKSRRFPRSPPIQRQTSICVQDAIADQSPALQHHHTEFVTMQVHEAPRGSSLAALASPEESSSMDGCTTASDDVAQASCSSSRRKSSSSAAEELTRVAVQVHCEAEGSITTTTTTTTTTTSSSLRKTRRHQHRLSATDVSLSSQPLVSPIESPTVRMRYVLTPPDGANAAVHCSRSLETRKKRPASSPEAGGRSQQLLRPASAMDVRGTLAASQQLREAGSAEDGARLQAMLEARSREHGRRLLLRPGRGATAAAASDEDEEPRAKVRYNDAGSMEEVDDVEGECTTCTTDDTTTTSEAAALTPEVGEEEGGVPDVTKLEVEGEGESDCAAAGGGSIDRQAAEQYRQLWQLRATFEVENDEDQSDEVAPPGVEEADLADGVETVEVIGNGNRDTVPSPPAQSPDRVVINADRGEAEQVEMVAVTEEDEENVECDPHTNCCSAAPDSALEELHLQGSSSQSPPPTSDTSSPPGHQARRQSYKAILNKRAARNLESQATTTPLDSQPPSQQPPAGGGGGGSVDNSFDSLETEESASTDASRCGGLELVTTSMESTCTDNTDSTGEGQVHHRLQQMKADSGYKSLEVQQVSSRSLTVAGSISSSSKRQIHFVLSADDHLVSGTNSLDESMVVTDDLQEAVQHPEEETEVDAATAAAAMLSLPLHRPTGSHRHHHHHHQHHQQHREKVLSPAEMTSIDSSGSTRTKTHTTFSDRKLNGKSASRKRRDYTRERHVAETSFSISSITELDDVDNGAAKREVEGVWDEQGKASVFLRFFRAPPPPSTVPPSTSSSGRHQLAACRDFSVDEQTDAIFREFSRRDPAYDLGHQGRCRSPRLHPRHRLYHRHLPDSGGTSSGGEGGGGSSSGRVTRSKLSPQDSIEEEQGGGGGVKEELVTGLDLQLEATGVGGMASVHIPIIKVAGDDSSS